MYTKIRNFIVLFVVLALLTPALTGAMPVHAQAKGIPQAVSSKVVKCPMPLPPTEIEGKTIICGQIEVPENWDKPTGRLLTINYARQVSKNLAPIADPIIFFTGGPGGSVLASQGSFGFDFSYLRETRDVIVWDQRGTRYSDDLRCPINVQVPDDAARQAKLTALGEPTFTLKSDPQAVLDFARQKVAIEGASRCAAYFAKEGIDLAQYNTPNTVRDAIALMHHLGYSAYNLFGISYGTQIALAIADYYGKNLDAALPPIRSILIDGVFPVNMDEAEEALVVPYNTLRIFADCEADAACGKAYPKIRQRLIDLLAKLESAPLKTEAGTEVTLDNLREVLFTAVQTRNIPLITYLPRLVDELTRGETATYDVTRAIIAGQVQPAEPAAPDATSILDPVKVETSALAQELRTMAGRLDTLGNTTDDLAKAIDKADTLPKLYVNVLNRYLESVDPSERNGYADMVTEVYVLHPEQQTRQGLVNLAEALPTEVAGELTAIANLLSDVEARLVWDTLTDDRTLQNMQVVGEITNSVVKCNDRGGTFKIGQVLKLLSDFEAPQLVTNFMIPSYYEARCEYYGLAASKYVVPPAVTTAYPVLVMNGGLDHATPVEWAKLAFKTLTNARIVIVPQTDHGSTRFSKCAKDIANTFFLYPDAKLNTACVEAFRPVFVLPDATLPPVATK